MRNETKATIESLQAANILTDMELFQTFGYSIGESQKVEGMRNWDVALWRKGLANVDKELYDFRPVDRLGVHPDVAEKLDMNTPEGKEARVAELELAYATYEQDEISPFDMGYGPESVE